MSGRHSQTPMSSLPSGDTGGTPTSPRNGLARGGVGPSPAQDSTPGAGRATTAAFEGAQSSAVTLLRRAIARRSWSLVDGLGRFLQPYGNLALVALVAAGVPAAFGFAYLLRGVA